MELKNPVEPTFSDRINQLNRKSTQLWHASRPSFPGNLPSYSEKEQRKNEAHLEIK